MKYVNTAKKFGAVAVLAAVSGSALAGADATFQGAVQMLQDWSEGPLGMLIALSIVIVGLAVGIVKQSIMGVVVGIGAALVLMNAATIITGMFPATL